MTNYLKPDNSLAKIGRLGVLGNLTRDLLRDVSCCVYQITNKANNKVYVGWTSNFHTRMIQHFSKSSGCTALRNAIQKYGKENFEISILHDGLTEGDAKTLEIMFIAKFKSNINRYGSVWGYNLTDGGDGIIGSLPWNKGKKGLVKPNSGSFKRGQPSTNRKITENQKPEIVAKYNSGMTQKEIAEEYDVSLSTINNIVRSDPTRRPRSHTETSKEKMSKSHQGKPGYWEGQSLSPEHRGKISDSHKGKKLTEEHKKNISVSRSGGENK